LTRVESRRESASVGRALRSIDSMKPSMSNSISYAMFMSPHLLAKSTCVPISIDRASASARVSH